MPPSNEMTWAVTICQEKTGNVVVCWATRSVAEPAEARALLEAVDVTTQIGLRARALIALMAFSFTPVGAALAMKVEDMFVQNRRLRMRLREKGGKAHAIPCHHSLEDYLTAYLEQTGIMKDGKGPQFWTIGHGAAHPHAAPSSKRLRDDHPTDAAPRSVSQPKWATTASRRQGSRRI